VSGTMLVRGGNGIDWRVVGDRKGLLEDNSCRKGSATCSIRVYVRKICICCSEGDFVLVKSSSWSASHRVTWGDSQQSHLLPFSSSPASAPASAPASTSVSHAVMRSLGVTARVEVWLREPEMKYSESSDQDSDVPSDTGERCFCGCRDTICNEFVAMHSDSGRQNIELGRGWC
jgi:hypothetical protein